MHMIESLEFGKPFVGEISVALGNFDGVHLGHRTLLDEVCRLSSEHNTAACVLTFADNLLGKESIYDFTEKKRLLGECGANLCIMLYFCRVSQIKGREFFAKLKESYRIRDIVCGENYTFGSDRCDVTTLAELCEQNNIALKVMPLVDFESVRVSSTAIRTFLRTGNVDMAGKLLGMKYHIRGRIVAGDGRGRGIGIPTLNLDLPIGMMEIKRGVYGTYAELDGKMYRAVTNYGPRPTFLQNKFAIETNILDYSSERVLGSELTVYFHKYLRPITKFATAEELVTTIKKDKEWTDIC